MYIKPENTEISDYVNWLETQIQALRIGQSEQLACDICDGSGFRWSPYYAKEVVCDCKR